MLGVRNLCFHFHLAPLLLKTQDFGFQGLAGRQQTTRSESYQNLNSRARIATAFPERSIAQDYLTRQILPIRLLEKLFQAEACIHKGYIFPSSFTSAHWLLPHFFDNVLTRVPRRLKATAKAAFNGVKTDIENELNHNAGAIPTPVHSGEMVKFIALDLAMRVEFGKTTAEYDQELLEILAAPFSSL